MTAGLSALLGLTVGLLAAVTVAWRRTRADSVQWCNEAYDNAEIIWALLDGDETTLSPELADVLTDMRWQLIVAAEDTRESAG